MDQDKEMNQRINRHLTNIGRTSPYDPPPSDSAPKEMTALASLLNNGYDIADQIGGLKNRLHSLAERLGCVETMEGIKSEPEEDPDNHIGRMHSTHQRISRNLAEIDTIIRWFENAI